MAGSQLHEVATDCVCVLLQSLKEEGCSNQSQTNGEIELQLQRLQLCLFTSVMNLEQPYHLSVAHEDMEKYFKLNLYRIVLSISRRFFFFLFLIRIGKVLLNLGSNYIRNNTVLLKSNFLMSLFEIAYPE